MVDVVHANNIVGGPTEEELATIMGHSGECHDSSPKHSNMCTLSLVVTQNFTILCDPCLLLWQ